MSISNIYSSAELARLSVAPQRAELFLERFANLDSTNEQKVRTFAERFSDLLPTQAPPPVLAYISDAFFKKFGVRRRFLCDRLHPQLQNIWKQQAPLMKEAGLMMLAAAYMKYCSPPAEATDPALWPMLGILGIDIKGPDRFLMVLLHALKHVHLLRYCLNPKCKEPYFVARRGSQIYCSLPCAAPAQKEAKLKWWRERGVEWRKKSGKRRGKHAKAKKA